MNIIGCLAASSADFIPRVKPYLPKPEPRAVSKDKAPKSEYRATQQELVQTTARVNEKQQGICQRDALQKIKMLERMPAGEMVNTLDHI